MCALSSALVVVSLAYREEFHLCELESEPGWIEAVRAVPIRSLSKDE